MPRIAIRVADLELYAELEDNPTAAAILAALPLEGRVNVWGDELYFAIPPQLPEAPDASAECAVGDLAYWPPGQALCLFFGPTPASVGATPRAASPVNRCGRLLGDSRVLRRVADGSPISIRAR